MELAESLQQTLTSHRRQLAKHLRIWKRVQVDHAQDVEIRNAAESCQLRTEQMIQQCSSIDFLKIANGNDSSSRSQKRSRAEDDLPNSKKVRRESDSVDTSPIHGSTSNGQHIPVTKDPSGLFLIDSNPDIDLLNKISEDGRKQQKRQKRAHAPDTEETDTTPLEVERKDNEHLPPKRKKAKHSEPTKDTSENKDDEEEERTRAMEQKVVLRLKEKDETSKKKANKKRKRESDMSVQETHADVEERAKPPPSKKVKGKAKAVDTATTSAEDPTDPPQEENGILGKKRNRHEKDVRNGVTQPKSKKKKKGKSGT